MKKPFLTALMCTALTSALSPASAQDVPNVPLPGRERFGPLRDISLAPPMFPGTVVINDLEQLHRLYAITGREDEMIGIYHDVLKATQDPMIRNYVYDSLARVQLKPARTDDAIATLRTSLAEDLAELKQRAPASLADKN
ncbi:MAG TPA: hypothetical protein VKS80_05610 [Trinickia sp.]|nr:hypothetical protein [Trinickia sp.]